MDAMQRLNLRWGDELAEVGEYAARSAGRLVLLSASERHLRLEVECTSAFQTPAGPEVRRARHALGLYREAGWPAVPVRAVHEAPPGIWSPHIIAPSGGPPPASRAAALQRLMGAALPGLICYGRVSPGFRLVQLVAHLYNLLGYRFGAYSRTGEHLNAAAVAWVNRMLALDEGIFPLEREPLLPNGGIRDRR